MTGESKMEQKWTWIPRQAWSLCAIFIAIAGCTGLCTDKRKALSPEEVVAAYLDVALNMREVDQRQVLLDLTTGPLHESIAKASDDTIKQAYIDRVYRLERYSVVERRDRTPRETEVTFEIVYRQNEKDEKAKPEDTPQIRTENVVGLVREKDAWYLRDVINKKSSIDFPVSMGAVVTPDPNGSSAE